MTKYLNQQIREIKDSKICRIYALILVLPHLFTFFYWQDLFPFVFSNRMASICWPLLNDCQSTHVFSHIFSVFALWSYLALIFACVYNLLKLKNIHYGYFLLLFLNVFKYFIVLQDYRFMGNYHYMPLLLSFAFLLLPHKVQLSKILILLFYFSASLLKFNYEWVSGMSIGESLPGIPIWLFRVGCAYVVVLEAVFVFGLLSPLNWLRWLTLVQLLAFHSISWYWVGYFYPLNMFSLLAIFPLSWMYSQFDQSEDLFWREKPKSAFLFLALFLACQIVPRFLPGDLALDGRLRITMLNMYDARSVCLKTILLHYKKSHIEWGGDTDLAVRIHCDPVVVLSDARLLCEEQRMNPDFVNVDVYLVAKRLTDSKVHSLLNIKDYCTKIGTQRESNEVSASGS